MTADPYASFRWTAAADPSLMPGSVPRVASIGRYRVAGPHCNRCCNAEERRETAGHFPRMTRA